MNHCEDAVRPVNHPFEAAMREALCLARRGCFMTAPNPAVGAVLVRDGEIVAGGYHKGAGLPHAEIEALRDAQEKGIDPAACTMVVTLEPCCHHGRTPPCTDAILAAGIRHVVIGALDPNPQAGGGAELLRTRGVQVETGILRTECEDTISDFVTWQTTPYPYVILKLASTLDGRIATRTGHSQWITGTAARRRVHHIRRVMDAVMVGGNTFHYDSPSLTYRPDPDTPGDPPAERQPLAVIVTSRLPDGPGSSPILRDRPEQAIFWSTVASAASPKAEALRKRGAHVLGLSSTPGVGAASHGPRAALDLAEGLAALRKDHGCHYVLCEGGGRLGLSLLRDRLVGELHLHMSPRILGDNEAIPLFDGLSPHQMDEAFPLRFVKSEMLEDDLLLTLRPVSTASETDPGIEGAAHNDGGAR